MPAPVWRAGFIVGTLTSQRIRRQIARAKSQMLHGLLLCIGETHLARMAMTTRCRPMFAHNISQVTKQTGAGSFSMTSCSGHYVMDWGLAAAIAQLWVYKHGTENIDILELGAGCGCYTEYLQWLGFRVRAYDGVPNIAKLSGGLVVQADLSKPQKFSPADWVLTLEVAEHILPEDTGTFLANIVQPAKHGIVLSWAIPRHSTEKNSPHVNEKPNKKVVLLMQKLGMHLDETATQRLRSVSGAFCCPYFRTTTMVFVREPKSWTINPFVRYGMIGSKIPRHSLSWG